MPESDNVALRPSRPAAAPPTRSAPSPKLRRYQQRETAAQCGVHGVHEAAIYTTVAHELGAEAPVLHAVVHTHRNFAEPPASTAVDGDDVTEPRTLRESLAVLERNVRHWAELRLAERVAAEAQVKSDERNEARVQERIRCRRAAEQDRALHRIQRITASVLPSVTAALQDRAAHAQTVADRTVNRTMEEADDTTSGAPCDREGDSELVATLSAAHAHELAQHDRDRAERLQHLLSEMRSCETARLVERHMTYKFLMRLSYERQHWLATREVAHDEQLARVALVRLALADRQLAALQSDETRLRQGVVQSEVAHFDQLASRCRVLGLQRAAYERLQLACASVDVDGVAHVATSDVSAV